MDLLLLKISLLLLMFFVTVFASVGPVKLLKLLRKKAAVIFESDRRKHGLCSLLLCLLTCFSAGVFLATCFLHLLPELSEQLRRMQATYHYEWDYPVAELLSCVGFFLLFFIEELFITLFPSAHSHHHDQQQGPHRRNSELLLPSPSSHPTQPSPVNWAVSEPERCEVNCERVKEDPPILMKSRPHPHSHGIRSVTFVLAISFHSIIEGIALGVQNETNEVVAIFISLLVHKVIVAFSVGLQLSRTHAHSLKSWVYVSLVLFALMTPIGGVAGSLVHAAPQIHPLLRDWIVLVMQGIAVGTFIYVTFFEVLIHERNNEHPALLKLLLVIAGFAMIGLLRLVSHSHSHAHDEHSSGSATPHQHTTHN